MGRRERILAVVAGLALVLALRAGQQTYRWYRFAPERAEIARLEAELEDAAVGVITTQVSADTMVEVLEAFDLELRDARGDLDRFERGPLDAGVATTYRRALRTYNARVGERNDLFGRWRSTLESNRRFVDRYNLLADSIRGLAERIGEPYYPIRTPAEIAVGRGLGGSGN